MNFSVIISVCLSRIEIKTKDHNTVTQVTHYKQLGISNNNNNFNIEITMEILKTRNALYARRAKIQNAKHVENK